MTDETKAYEESEQVMLNAARVPFDPKAIGTRIGKAADRLGTRRNAAATAGASVDSLQRWIRGENMPAFDVAARLCLGAGVLMEWVATGDEPMLAAGQLVGKAPEPAPQKAPAPDADEHQDREQRLLATAVRILEDALHKYEIRAYVEPDEYAELVRFVLQDLRRGAAEDAAQAALNRILNITRAPQQP